MFYTQNHVRVMHLLYIILYRYSLVEVLEPTRNKYIERKINTKKIYTDLSYNAKVLESNDCHKFYTTLTIIYCYCTVLGLYRQHKSSYCIHLFKK